MILNIQTATALDGAMRSPCLEVLNKVGLETFTDGLPIFVPVNQFSLLNDIENHLYNQADKVIFLLDQNIPPTETFLNRINYLKAYSYRFALEKITDFNAIDSIIKLCDFVFVNCALPKFPENKAFLEQNYPHLSLVATNVNSLETFEKLKKDKFAAFEGRFYSVPLTKGKTEISPVKVNYIRLLTMVANEDFNIDEAADIISRDTYLSISLFKLVNSPYLGLAQKIKTVKHAVAMLGQQEVKKWVATAVTGLLSSERPDEITRLSLTRAKFAENLAKPYEMAMHSQSLFLMGLFSILDVVLGVDIEEALKIIPVTDKISNALIHKTGDYAKILEFIYTYETANWTEVSRLMILDKLDSEDIFDAYMNAVLWYSSIAFDNKTDD
jgi:EAL and modified HD-GYP domain-containing signal transduction protein